MEKQWYVLYVKSRSEKKLKSKFDTSDIEAYLPLKVDYRRWSDRVKKVHVPLFPSYVFVRISAAEVPDIYRFSEIVSVVKTGNNYACLSDEGIISIKRFEESGMLLEIGKEPLGMGEAVEIIAGPLVGMKGVLIEKAGHSRFVLRLDVLDQVIKVQLPSYQLKKINR